MTETTTTRNPDNQRYDRRAQTRQGTSFSMSLIGNLVDALVLLLVALVFSVITEWIGMLFFWEEEGAMHSERMLITELGYLNEDFKHSLFGYTPVQIATETAAQVDYWLFEATLFRDILAWLVTAPADAGKFRRSLAYSVGLVQDYIAAAINATQLFGVRLAIAVLSTPAFLLIGLAALIDGLVRRDIRRFSGSHESSFVYHNIKPWVRPAFIGAWFIYLGSPWSLHPNVIFIPAALLFGMAIYLTSSMFKKFL
jgi:integrating conjugative element membrane protein (TIGR03747 family)